MGLSRLEAFLKSVRGNLLHVDPNALDSTDSIENDGSSQMVPFKTLNRALAEAARFSYQAGLDNDRFGRTTILIYPGQHLVDNRPGAFIDDTGSIKLRSGANTTITPWSLDTVYDITSATNDLYKLNSVHGGLILPRGVSIVAKDLRKTVIRPLYVPDPTNNAIERSAIFRLTGASFLYGFSVLDADPNGLAYKDYTTLKHTPTFSHHKLTCFEYADGVNDVAITDIFNQSISTSRTDLEMYYEKISLVYGDSSGRPIDDVIYSTGAAVDIQPVVDEFRIVGSRGKDFQISEIRAGNGFTPTNIITVTTTEPLEGISVDTSIQVSGINESGYSGQFTVFRVLGTNQFQYKSSIVPQVASPEIFGANISIVTDTVSSASPYVFNVSLRSVYGMCGLHADGSKADGFKSMVVAQFTGIGIQKDDNAFVLYDKNTGVYRDSVAVPNLYKNSRARFKPEYENYHIKVSEGGFCQLVSIFAIGFANQFLAESGGDYSITNSNSNFGSKALVSDGFSRDAFPRDDVGFITKIIPPRDIESQKITVEFNSIDVGLTTTSAAGAATTTRLYLYDEKDFNNPPRTLLDGYRVGAAKNETLYLENSTASVVIPDTTTSYEKSFNVARINNNTENSISSGIINFTQTDTFQTGEKVRVVSDNGYLPDGIEDKIYYAIDVTTGGNNQIRLAETFDSALNNVFVNLNTKGGNLRVVSRVSDKNVGEIGHPVQWDSIKSNWYITVAPNSTLYTHLLSKTGVETTNKTYIERIPDRRNIEDTIYKFEYVIPKDSSVVARPPVDGYVLQKSNKNLLGENEIDIYFGDESLQNVNDLRSPKYISNATWNAGEAIITSELDHELLVGSKVKIENVVPDGYNGTYTVKRITNSKQFVVDIIINPGLFSNNTTTRDLNLPYFQPKETVNTYKLYTIETIQEYIPEKQDGIYELIILNNSVSPIASPFNNIKLSQPIKNLYPQTDRDNPSSDPKEAVSFAKLDIIGEVTLDSSENSITKETLTKFISDFNVGFGVTAIVSDSVGTSHTIYTTIDHGLSQINSFSIVSAGSSYVPGTYYGVDLQGSATGIGAKVAIDVNSTGNISSVQIMDGGSCYAVGNTLSILPRSGIGTTTGFVPATISVTSISNNINEVVSLSGYTGINTGYNNLYRITSIPANNRIVVSSAGIVTNFSTSLVSSDSTAVVTGIALTVSNFTYDRIVGIATVTTLSSHDLNLNQKIRLDGFTQSFYNKDVSVSKILSSTSFEIVGIGTSTTTPATTGTRIVHPYGYNTSQRGNDRGRYIYDKLILTNNSLVSSSSDIISITNAQNTGLKIGDYLKINQEVLRVKSPVVNSNVSVYRAQFGTVRSSHSSGSVIQRIKPIPIEFRRNTIIRASGHTFEYVGFGPGNYSTAFPERQDRKLSDTEKILSQSLKYNGGVVYYSGTDDSGDFYAGNKKTTSATGKEEVFDTPIQTFAGDESSTNEIVKTNDVVIDRSIRVGGGKNNNVVSEFNGPIVLNEKLTSYSPEGIEVPSIFLQGDQEISRRYSISNEEPSISGNYGDIIYRASPNEGENIGWVYTTNDRWKTWGYVGDLGTQISIYSGVENGSNILEGVVDKLKFVGDPNGFGIDVDIEIDPTVGFGTIVLRNPIDIINFGTSTLGTNAPTFTTRSNGTRIVYYDSLDTNNVDYAVGIGSNILWNSIPKNESGFSFKWYGGQVELMSLSGSGQLTVSNGIIGVLNGDVNGNATTATTAINLTRSVIAGVGLTGGGILNNQNVTLSVGQGSGITVSGTTVGINTDVVVTRSDNQSISGIKTFTNTIQGTITNAINASTSTTSTNLNRSVIAGNGLTGGGILNGQDVTLNIGQGSGITVNADSIQVDSTVVRDSGPQTIGGVKTFTSTISGSITGNAGSVTNGVYTVGDQSINGILTVNDLFVGTDVGDPAANAGNTNASRLGDGVFSINRIDEVPVRIGRSNNGALIWWFRNGNNEGTISNAGGTISYGTFLGTHWGRFEDGSKPDVLPGTILETVNKLIEWKVAVFNVNGEEKISAYEGSLKAGDTIQIGYEGNIYDAIIKNEEEIPYDLNKHVCVKISDTPASKKVFGVFLGWDDNDIPEKMVNTWNDMNCAAIGNYFIRIASGQTLEIGDLIESDGNGCGRVQDDDIIRSKTVGKVTSTIPQRVYDDGSFLVTAVLYCG
jgi:hypothetical protein